MVGKIVRLIRAILEYTGVFIFFILAGAADRTNNTPALILALVGISIYMFAAGYYMLPRIGVDPGSLVKSIYVHLGALTIILLIFYVIAFAYASQG